MSREGSKLSVNERMARIRKVNTKPEIAVRHLAHALGYRFRLHRQDLPGTPDLVFPRLRKVILVHGCFWHRHLCKDGQKLPSGRRDYWEPKFARNVERDARDLAGLRELGWDALVIWECELRDMRLVETRLRSYLCN